MRIYFYIFLFFLFGCGQVEFSPNQKYDSDTPTDINIKNIAKLQSQTKDDTVRFVLTGDSQRAYSACKGMVSKINSISGVDFVILNGDISDFGLYQEMEWVNDIYSQIKVPYIAILGNHDMSGNGKDVYRRMYGNENFTFVYQGVKFLCFDSNGREYNFNGSIPDLNWLDTELKPQTGVKNYVAVSHIPSFNEDFDAKLEKPFGSMINGNKAILASLHAHINKTEALYPYGSTPFIVTTTIAEKEFILIDIVNGNLTYKVITY